MTDEPVFGKDIKVWVDGKRFDCEVVSVDSIKPVEPGKPIGISVGYKVVGYPETIKVLDETRAGFQNLSAKAAQCGKTMTAFSEAVRWIVFKISRKQKRALWGDRKGMTFMEYRKKYPLS